ncbi:MAG: hypothetical protein L6R28_23705 [Planctomycetes bacterium]|nr:hypothetical protein [Planctomycetota bacterium]
MAAGEWSEKVRMIVTIVVVVVVNAACWGYVYMVGRDLDKLTKDLDKVKKEVEGKKAEASQLKDLEKQKRDLHTENERRMKMLSSAKEDEEFHTKLVQLQTKYSMSMVGSISPRESEVDVPGVPRTNFRRTVWKMNYNTPFWGLIQMLNKLEEHEDRFYVIENLSLTAKGAGMSITGVRHSCNFDISTYRYVSMGP